VGVISFHSLEDRIVKGAFPDLVKRGLAEHVGKGPIEADESEVRENVRARSAKLRVVRIVDSSSGERRG
jgi:16S rRNA (cytosine1402-N4)-methyltransferase